jgi:class 3 adenylate cyclase
VLVADVVRQLAAGKGFLFSDCGEVILRGFDDPVRPYEVRWRESATQPFLDALSGRFL